jgi:hypothetical protein
MVHAIQVPQNADSLITGSASAFSAFTSILVTSPESPPYPMPPFADGVRCIAKKG